MGCMEMSNSRRLGSLMMTKVILNLANSFCNAYYKMQLSLWNHSYIGEFILLKYRSEIKVGTSLQPWHLLDYAPSCKLPNTHIPSVALHVTRIKRLQNPEITKGGEHTNMGFFLIKININTEKGTLTWIWNQ